MSWPTFFVFVKHDQTGVRTVTEACYLLVQENQRLACYRARRRAYRHHYDTVVFVWKKDRAPEFIDRHALGPLPS